MTAPVLDARPLLTKGAIARYVLLPGIIPRVRDLSRFGLDYIAALIALVYGMVRLLPPRHPYLNPANQGRFGIRQVIAAAADNLHLDWKHADQVIIFFAIIAGVVILFLQFILLILSFSILPALAMPSAPLDFFSTPFPTQDIAFILLDRVFGIPSPSGFGSFFGSCVGMGIPCTDPDGDILIGAGMSAVPTPFQFALRGLLEFYNAGIFLVGVMVIIYLAMTVAGETAQSGTPFGTRFNKVWAPVRLIFFFFMILPVVYGLNICQMAVMHTAYWGSSMATNGWLLFNQALANPTMFGAEKAGPVTTGGMIFGQFELEGTSDPSGASNLVAIPNTPDPGPLLQFYNTVHACKYAERILHNRYVQAYLVRPRSNAAGQRALYLWKYPDNDVVTNGIEPAGGKWQSFAEALDFSENGDVVIRFGEYNPDLYPNETGFVYPYCGEITLVNPGITSTGLTDNPGAYIMFVWWYHFLGINLWADSSLHNWGSNIARTIVGGEKDLPIPDTGARTTQVDYYKTIMKFAIKSAVIAQANGFLADVAVPAEILNKGWAGAGIWYNRIAKLNGSLVDSVFNTPRPKRWPDALEQILDAKRKKDSNVWGSQRFNPTLSDNLTVKFKKPQDADIARAENLAYQLWERDESASAITPGELGVTTFAALLGLSVPPDVKGTEPVSGNAIVDSINSLLGTAGLFNMRENVNTHPLAQLVGIGRAMINSAIVNFGYAAGAVIGGGIGTMLQLWTGEMAKAASGFAFTIASLGLMIGFILFYVIPFLPFVYFFFAVGGWIKAIFEAMVGVPLWALAHLRIDGDGLPGKMGMSGYFLLFEIFVRPILTVFGLLAGIIILTAMVRTLNEVWDLVTINLAGHDASQDPGSLSSLVGNTYATLIRNAVDEFMFTVMYAIIVYMMAMSSFKLIDMVPNQILRWLGGSVSAFGENLQDPGGQLLGMTYRGGMAMSSGFGRFGASGQTVFHSMFVK